jgi:cytidylate kinase
VAPLQVPPDAMVVDTTEMTLEEVVKKIYAFAIERIRQ